MILPAVNVPAASPPSSSGSVPSSQCLASFASIIIEGECPSVLRKIRRSQIDLAIWNRELPRLLSSWLEIFVIKNWLNLQQVLTPAEIARTLRRHFDRSGIKHCDGRAAFVDDVTKLVTLYADALRVTHVHLRLALIQDNSCTKFHRDCVTARLITTYHGPGTEFVTVENVSKALSLQHDYDGELLQCSTQSVGIFKGCRGEGEGGIHHRSPQIAGHNMKRLVLSVDASKSPTVRSS